MAELPKIVRDRMQATTPAAHPDADLLTAFAEKALGERERAQVLEHLAQCSACREVVSLALPEKEEEEAAAAPRGARGWVLRWESAAALAAVVVAATVLLLIPNSMFRSGRSTMPSTAQAPEQGKTEQAAAQKPAAPEAEAAGEEAKNAPASVTLPARKAAKIKGEAGGAGGGAFAAATEADKDRRAQTKAALAKTPPLAAPVGGTAVAMDQAAAQTAEKKQVETAGAAAADRAAAPVAPAPSSETVAVTGAAPAHAKEGSLARAYSTEPAASWRTTAAGKLERSLDAGQSWRAVSVAPGAVLNAVSAVGEHVWSGGHRQGVAVLYHSLDGGRHWARLDFSGPAPAADIVALDFTDGQHGAMTVILAEDRSLRQIWSSGDGGRSWAAPAGH